MDLKTLTFSKGHHPLICTECFAVRVNGASEAGYLNLPWIMRVVSGQSSASPGCLAWVGGGAEGPPDPPQSTVLVPGVPGAWDAAVKRGQGETQWERELFFLAGIQPSPFNTTRTGIVSLRYHPATGIPSIAKCDWQRGELTLKFVQWLSWWL